MTRSGKDAMNKIQNIETKYHEASNFIKNKGAGIIDEANFKDLILKRCFYFYEIQIIMNNRSSTSPLYSSGRSNPPSEGQKNNKKKNIKKKKHLMQFQNGKRPLDPRILGFVNGMLDLGIQFLH